MRISVCSAVAVGLLTFGVSACSSAPDNGGPAGMGAGAAGMSAPITGGAGGASGAGVAGMTATGGMGGVSGMVGIAGAAGTSTGGTGAIGGMTGGSAGMDAMGDASVGDGDGDASTEPAYKPPCTTKPSQVAMFGDSYMNWVSHTFAQDMANAAGETWRMYAIGGWAMGSGGIGLIPTQLDTALAEDPDIKVSVMTGGGNDILVPAATWMGGTECRQRADGPMLKVCQDIVQTALDAAQELMMKASEAGIKDVVYFFYPHVPVGTLIGGSHPNEMLDYALPKTRKLCGDTEMLTSGAMRCHFVDLVPLFEGHPELFAPTDIHENAMGSKVIADAIWAKMEEKCLAQDASSGCCEAD